MTMHWLEDPPTGTNAVPAARHWAQTTVDMAGRSIRHAEVVTLIASELVTDAVLHASGPYRFGVDAQPSCTRIEVWNHSQNVSLSGMGLALVENLSDRWGCRSEGAFTCVWSEVRA